MIRIAIQNRLDTCQVTRMCQELHTHNKTVGTHKRKCKQKNVHLGKVSDERHEEWKCNQEGCTRYHIRDQKIGFTAEDIQGQCKTAQCADQVDGNVPEEGIDDGPQDTKAKGDSNDGNVVIDVAVERLVVGHGYPSYESK